MTFMCKTNCGKELECNHINTVCKLRNTKKHFFNTKAAFFHSAFNLGTVIGITPDSFKFSHEDNFVVIQILLAVSTQEYFFI